MDEYQARIRAEEHARTLAQDVEMVKSAAKEFQVSVEEAISKLKVPEEYREEIMELLSHSK